jgi:hypothetical protein
LSVSIDDRCAEDIAPDDICALTIALSAINPDLILVVIVYP